MTNIFLFIYLVYLFDLKLKNFCYHVKYFLKRDLQLLCKQQQIDYQQQVVFNSKQFSAASPNKN